MNKKRNPAQETPAPDVHPGKPAHAGHRNRLRQQFLTSPDSLTDARLLELLLFYAVPRRDTYPLAQRLLDTYGSLKQVLCAPPASLRQVEGMTEQSVVLLGAVFSGAQRILYEESCMSGILRSTEEMAKYLRPKFLGERDEVVYLLCLDAKCKLLDCRQLTRGSVNMAGISVRKVMEAALACNATSVTLAHNHTSGVALPSAEDICTTERVWLALRTVGIRLNDHIIIAEDDYVSLAQDGLFARMEETYNKGELGSFFAE